MLDQAAVDVGEIIEQQKLSRFLIRLVSLSWIITFFDGFDMNVISYAAPYLATAYRLDRVMVGNIFSIGLVGTMIGGFLFGYLGDRFGRRPAIILATASFGVLTLGFALAESYGALLALRLITGIAIGGMLPLSWALNIEFAPKRYRSTVVTLVMIGYSLGTAMGGPASLWLIPKFGWQAVFVFGGLASILAAVALVFFLPESIRFLASKGKRPDTIARILRQLAPLTPIPAGARFEVVDEANRNTSFKFSALFLGELRLVTPLLWIAYIFSSMTTFFLATWTPLVFEAVGFTRATAAAAGSVNTLCGALGGLLLMRFTDNKGPIAITAMPALAIPFLLVTGLGDLGDAGFLVANALVALFVIGGHLGLHSIAGILYPSAYRGNGAGWATSVAKIGSIAGPWLAGLILSTHLPVKNIFAIVAVCPAVFVVCIFIVGRQSVSARHGPPSPE